MADRCRFFVPGPVWVRPEILAETVRPPVGHRGEEFVRLHREVVGGLRRLFETDAHAVVVTASGTALLEAALRTTVSRSVVVTTVGAFSERWLRIAASLGLDVDHVGAAWGEAIDPGRLEGHLRARGRPPEAVTITHNETSTGVIQDLQGLAAAVRAACPEALVLVDAVSSFGGAPLRFDAWGLDVCVSSSQKCLGLPAGLAVAAISGRALERAKRVPERGTYLDLLEYVRCAEERGSTPFTPAVPLVRALGRQLLDILEVETPERRWSRHRRMRDRTLDRCAAFAPGAVERERASPTVSALRTDDAPRIVESMRERGFAIGTGYGSWKADTFRVGHMGDMPETDLEEMLAALEEVAT